MNKRVTLKTKEETCFVFSPRN